MCSMSRLPALLCVFMVCATNANAQGNLWTQVGPAPTTEGQVEGIKDGEVSGAINVAVPHPTDSNIMYIGSVNGGVWKTTDAMAASPTWKSLTDDVPSLSIGALALDPTDASANTLLAGAGRFSSLSNLGGSLAGLLYTTDGGATWKVLDGGGQLRGLNVSGVAPRGDVLVISVNRADNPNRAGIWRSTDQGATWTHLSGAMGTGLKGASPVLAADPKEPKRLFTISGNNLATSGLFRSDDSGATWVNKANMSLKNKLFAAANAKIAVGHHNNVFVAIVAASTQRLSSVFRSADGGDTWTEMALPTIAEGGIHPGGQGGIHLSLAADPANANIVYIGGDRQDGLPNSIGAFDYSGIIFRGDASLMPAKQWVHITHKPLPSAANSGTKNRSAPHADSRGMAVAANGVLIEVDDGGVYKRTDPTSALGDWFSLNGNLQVTEFHAVAWDPRAKIAIGGAQDTGTPQQKKKGVPRWGSVSKGDGGVVAVDYISSANRSIRYSSYYNLADLRRQTFDNTGTLIASENPTMIVLDSGNPIDPQFYTPIRVNRVNGLRLVFGAANSLYESIDQGDSLMEIGPGIRVNGTGPNPIAYGTQGNEAALYVGAGSKIYVRLEEGDTLNEATAYTGSFVNGIALHSSDAKRAFVIDQRQVFTTPDGGASFVNISGNLGTQTSATLRSLAYVNTSPQDALVVGTDAGVFIAKGPTYNSWSKFGTGLPQAPVYYLEYNAFDAMDKVFVAGTLGRGVWVLRQAAMGVAVAPPPVTTVASAVADGADMDDVPQERFFEFRPGILVGADTQSIFLMNPRGGLQAVSAATGAEIWATKAAAKPLGLIGGQLVGQVEPEKGIGNLKVVALDAKTGAQKSDAAVELPPGVVPAVQATIEGEFLATASAANSEAVVSWQFVERPKRAVAPGTKSVLPPKEGVPVPAATIKSNTERRGAFRFNLQTGAASPTEDVVAMIPKTAVARSAPPKVRIKEISGPQFLSANGRHLMTSKRRDDAAATDYKYELTVYQLPGKEGEQPEKLGSFLSHSALVPFFVAKSDDRSLAIYETLGAIRTVDGELRQEPTKIRAVDLKNQKEVWQREVRDIAFRGTVPP